jgi:hypothetical protein
VNYLIAKNVADEEMGRYGEHPLEYSLQQKTKDALLAHGRQDAAHALCNTKSIMDQNARIAAQPRLELSLVGDSLLARRNCG